MPPGAAADAFAAGQHQDDQSEPDPEFPVFGRRRGNHVPQHDERRRADEAAVEISRAADDQHQHDVGRAMKVEQIERHDLRRLGQQRARRARVSRRNRIDRDDPPAGVDAKRAGAQAVLPDRGQRQPEGRLREAARDREQDEEDGEAVERRVALPGEADREQAEAPVPMEKLRPSAPPVSQPLRLASSPSISETPSVTMSRVRSPPRSRSGAVTRPATAATAAPKASPSMGSARPPAGENGRGIGAKAEERRVAERDDPGQVRE